MIGFDFAAAFGRPVKVAGDNDNAFRGGFRLWERALPGTRSKRRT
jgi:hypothetical protein